MSDHCLVATHLTLHEPDRLSSGVFRRLGMLVEAVVAAGAPVRLFCTLPPDIAETEATNVRIADLLRTRWGVAVEVVACRRAAASPRAKRPWSPLLGALRPPMLRGAFAERVRRGLAAELARSPRFVLAHRLASMMALIELGVPLPPVYFDLDDLAHRVIWRGLPLPGPRRQKAIDAACLPAIVLAERKAIRAATRTFVCSRGDAIASNRLSGRRNAAVVPNAVTLRPVARRASGAAMLMVGIWSYEPNADGAQFFVEEVLPLVRARVPEAELWLVGASPEAIPAFARAPEGVRFLGFVDDLQDAYARARLVICPIRFGGGTRVKLVEAAAAGKAIVSTTLGAEGLGMTSERHALLADDPRTFADACVRLLRDDALVDRLGAQARELAAASFDRARIVAALADELRRAGRA